MEWVLIIFSMVFTAGTAGLGNDGHGGVNLIRVPALIAPFTSKAACETGRMLMMDSFYTRRVADGGFVRCLPIPDINTP